MDADAPQVEPVGIPASLDRDVSFGEAIAVEGAGIGKMLKAAGWELKDRALKGFGEIGCPPAMVQVPAVLKPPGIVQIGKKLNGIRVRAGYLGQSQADGMNPLPVSGPVDACLLYTSPSPRDRS